MQQRGADGAPAVLAAVDDQDEALVGLLQHRHRGQVDDQLPVLVVRHPARIGRDGRVRQGQHRTAQTPAAWTQTGRQIAQSHR